MATIRDVAHLCGVSTATVSHVLHGRLNRVSPDTRDKVMAAIRELRYRPPALEARSSESLAKNIGVIFGELSAGSIIRHTYFRNLLDGILDAATMRGFSATIVVERMWAESGDAIRRGYDGRCDGVILVAPSATSPIIPVLLERGVPISSIGVSLPHSGVTTVDIDNALAAETLVDHLVQLGHRRIAYIGGDSSQVSVEERAEGYRRAMARHGLAGNRKEILCSGTSEEDAYRRRAVRSISEGGRQVRLSGWAEAAVDFLLQDHPDYTAYVGWNDDIARSMVRALQAAGKRVPLDVSVVGVDDVHFATDEQPELTTMRQPFQIIGRRAADLLIDRIERPESPQEFVRFTAELIVRNSTGPAPSNILQPRIYPEVGSHSNGGNH